MNRPFNFRPIVWISFVILFAMAVVSRQALAAASTAPSAAVSAALEKRLPSVQFNALPLADGFDFLRDITELNLIVDWHALEAMGIKRDAPVSATGHDIKFAHVISLLLDSVAAPTSRPVFVGVTDAVVVSSPAGLQRIQHDSQAVLDLIAKADAAPLAKRLPAVQFNQTPLADAIAFFRDVSGVNIAVNWNALADVGVKKDTPVSLTGKGLTLGQALVLIFDTSSDATVEMQIGWDDNVITITATKK